MSRSFHRGRRMGLDPGVQPVDYGDDELLQAAIAVLWGTGLTPRAQLTTQANPGDTELVVSDPAQFTPGGIVQFRDGTTEVEYAIDSSWDGEGAVPLTFGGYTQTGLVEGHAVGAWVGTNLFKHVPNNIDGMLTGNNCVLYVTSPDSRSYREAMRQDEPQYTIHIDYLRRMVQPDTDMNTNLWGMRNQTLAHQHMHIIKNAFLDNPQLVSSEGAHVLDSGDPINATRERFVASFHQIVVSGVGPNAVVDYGATGEFSVRGFRRTFFPRS